MGDLINREALREGMIICRRTNGWIGKAILMATGIRAHWWEKFIPSRVKGWTHDAIIVRDPKAGRLKIGDALMEAGCQLTEIKDWERGCREEGTQIIVLWPRDVAVEQGYLAARWWCDHVRGHDYDHVAIKRLLLKAVAGDWISGKIGLESDFYCTEGVKDSWANGGRCNPWWPKVNATPGTTARRYLEGRLVEVVDALTLEGLKYRVDLQRGENIRGCGREEADSAAEAPAQ